MKEEEAYKMGTRDGASGRAYNEPFGSLSSLFIPYAIRANEAYKKGYNYSKGQRDGNRNKYEGYRSNNKQYNKGWNQGYSQFKDNNGGCFITTATLQSIGKSDNCKELNTFREFRDNWLISQPQGNSLIQTYYEIAPLIVHKINTLPDSKKIYQELWNNRISKCYDLILQNHFEEAKIIYCCTVSKLINEFDIQSIF